MDSPTSATAPASVRTDQTPAVSKRKAFVREASCHSSMLIAGWSDASSGPMIPFIQAFYGISYTVVSMLFVGQMVGFLSASFVNGLATERWGLGKVIAMGGIIQACGYVFLIPGFPFPVMPCCYAVIGFGMALQDAQANTYIAILPNADYKFGLLHASYGLGALVCPLAATGFVTSGIKFSYFYGISLGLSIINVLVLLNAFRFNYRIDTVEPGPEVDGSSSDEEGTIELGTLAAPVETKASAEGVEALAQSGATTPASVKALPDRKKSTLHVTLTNKTVWVFAIFILFYVGSEVSMGGWIVTFLIEDRDGGTQAGYVATGFWAGLTLGRAVLTPLNNWVGEKRVVFVYLALAICLELAIWFRHDFIGNSVTVALVGVLLGPLYPICMSLCTKVLPRSLHASGIGFIASLGQTGSALFPFITGALAQRFDPSVLQPVMIVLFVVQMGIWVFGPSVGKKKE